MWATRMMAATLRMKRTDITAADRAPRRRGALPFHLHRTDRPMRALHGTLLLALLALLGPSPLRAQSPADAEIRAVVARLFDGLRKGDSTIVRSALHPEARLQTTSVRDGVAVVQTESVDAFLRAIGTPHPELWDERVGEVEVRVDEWLATAWMPYRFYLGERFSHCGVNAMQFVRTAAGWQILQIIDTRRASCS